MYRRILDAHDPELPAFHQNGKTVIRRDLDLAARRAANYMLSLGLKRGDKVAIWLPDGATWLQLLFASAQIGTLLVPVSTRLKTVEALHIVKTSEARVLVVPSHFLDFGYVEAALEIRQAVTSLEHVVEVPAPDQFMWADFDPCQDEFGKPTDAWCTFSTSGTTGAPKLAVHTQAGITTHALNAAYVTNMNVGDASLCALPLYGVLGFVQAIATLAAGAACAFLPVFKAPAAAEAIEKYSVTHFYGSDAMLDMIMSALNPSYASWRHGGFAEFSGLGGKVVDKAWSVWRVPLTAVYGMSECLALCAVREADAPPEHRRIAGGRLISPGMAFRIADISTGAPVADGHPGELQLRGYNVMVGYLNNPEATSDTFTEDGWLRTGDLARAQGDSFQYLSRLKDSLRLRGYLVDPVEVEEYLCTHPAVLGAQVVGVNEPGVGDTAVAFVMTSDEGTSENDLLAFCKQGIAGYKIPKRIISIDGFPQIEGPNGVKVLKTVLRDLAKEHLEIAPLKIQT